MTFRPFLILSRLTLAGCNAEPVSTTAQDISYESPFSVSEAKPEIERSAKKPNILILIADDMGVDTMGLYGLS